MPQPYQDGYDPNIEQHGHLLRMMHGPDGQGVLYDRTTHPRASRSSRTKASDKLPVTLVHLETRIMRYIVILYFHMSHGPPFLRNSCTLEQAEEAREYVARFLPEIFDEVIKGTGLHLLFLLAPYYIQRIFESSLFEDNPVVNVDHRGQAVDVRQVWRDVSRVHSVTDGPYSEMTREYAGDNSAAYYQRNRIMPFSMHGFQQSATAMDDSQVAVGCQNGYIVVVSFD
ncbi:hypothetical protein EV175_004523 [Coemansia sp. RSA 1933]|nr:hypothetical protein EV175_004523 [Coemansia sp. RSA 1933]